MRRFHQISGQRGEEVAQQEDRERQAKRRVRRPDCPILTSKTESSENLQHWLKRDL